MNPRYFLLATFAIILYECQSYTLRNSVSWAVSSKDVVEEELDALSQEVAPAVLVNSGGIWQRTYPSQVLGEGAENPTELFKSEDNNVAALASQLFSYRMEEVKDANRPPPHEEFARTARYIAHSNDWGHLSTISTQDKIRGLPFGNIFPVSDGPLDNSTGVIYFYVTPKDNSVSDLASNPYASLTFSEAEGGLCRQMMYDPEDPRCARLTLTGKMVEVGPAELEFAKAAMFSRHPVMKQWPVGHNWFFIKLEIVQIWFQDWFGGVALIPLEEYFKATPL